MAGVGLDYGYFKYVTDAGENRCVKCNTFMAAFVDLALAAPTLTDPVIDADKCRAVYVQDSVGRTRTLIVGTAAAMGALTGADSWDLRDPGTATLATFNLVSKRSERPERVAHVIANQ